MKSFIMKKTDYAIIFFILVLSLVLLWMNLQHTEGSENRKYVSIYVDNNLVAELSAGHGESYSYNFNFGQGNEAVLEIDDGQVRMLPLGKDLCPKGICSHTGWIIHPHESIVCLPNRIMVTISGQQGYNNDIDGVTY